MHIDGALANLLQGISQQQPQNRLPGQCQEQINSVNDVVDGWKRRPPTEFLAELLGINNTLQIVWHFYNTGLEQYILAITSDGAIHIFELDGTAHTPVIATGSEAALAFTLPTDLSLVTIGDYTIIANANAVPAMKSTTTEDYTNTALVYLKDGGEYGRKYTITLDGEDVATYTTPGGSDPAKESALTGTEYVTEKLYSMLPSADLLSAVWVFANGGVSIDETAFSLVTQDNGSYPTATQYTPAFIGTSYTLTYTIVSNLGLYKQLAILPGSMFASTALTNTVGTHTVSLVCVDNTLPIIIAGIALNNLSITLSDVTIRSTGGDYSDTPPYTFKLAGSVIEITRTTGTDYIDVLVADDRGGQFAKVIQRVTDKAGDLPKYATPNHIIQITGEATSGKDDYYLKFTIEDGAQEFGVPGIWRECCKPGIPQELDSATMPKALIRMPDYSWLLTPLDGSTHNELVVEKWRLRSSGDDDTNPLPSFLGKPIVFLGTFQDRLYMLSDENASFSATSSYFNYFNKTATTILDSDPVDMPSAGNSIVKLRRAAQHDKNLVIFSDLSQFVVPGNKELTPKSSMILTTSYESDLLAQPVPAGVGLLFPITYGNYAGIREFITSAVSDTNSSQPITAHVPKFIPGHIKHMVVSSNFDVALIQSTEGANKLYVYKYLWQDGTRQQASFGVWEFNASLVIQTVFIKDASIYIIFKKGDTCTLEKLDMTDVPPAGVTHNVFVDSRVSLSSASTVYTLPYTTTLEDLLVIQGAGCAYPGQQAEVLSVVGAVVTLTEQQTGACFFGTCTRALLVPTMPMIKDTNGSHISNANFVLSKFMVSYKNTGSFFATVKNLHYDDFVVDYSGRTLGSLQNVVGTTPIDTGVLEVVVRKEAISTTLELETYSHLPMNLMAIEWEGDYTKRGRRV